MHLWWYCFTSSRAAAVLVQSLWLWLTEVFVWFFIMVLTHSYCWWCVYSDSNQHDSDIDITKWVQEYFQKPLSVNTIRRAICRCQLKPYHAKRKPHVKRRRVLWAKAHFKWTVSKWKSVLWSDKSKFDILVGNHGRHVLRAKEEGDLPACHQRSVQKPASLMGVHKCIWYGQLACFGRHYECWKV